MPTRIVVGLGNPGQRYANTRHNVGFMVIDSFAQKVGLKVDRNAFQALYAEKKLGQDRVVLVKPQTYMNLSGESVAAALRWYKASPQDLIVIYDDMDLPPGKIRLRREGSSGGQKGMQSIIQHLSQQEFSRIRIGVGRPLPGWEVPDWVLSPFTEEEKPLVQDALARAAEAVDVALRSGFTAAMNQHNR